MILAFKLLLTPLFIASVSLAGRRWGPGVSGLLMGLPLTSGPISFILASQYGRPFGAHAAIGTICGQASVCIFCLAYSLAAQRLKWFGSAPVAVAAFLVATATWNNLSLSLLPATAVLVAVIGAVLYLFPRHAAAPNTSVPPKWDLPARMIAAAAFVLLLTTFANSLGPQLSGLLSPFPIFGTVLAAFTHHQQGAGAASKLLHGVVLGSCAFGSFFLVVGALLPGLAAGWTYLLATLTAAGINSVFLYRAR